MALKANEVDQAARQAAGRQHALDTKATEFKEYGQTRPLDDHYPFTYWSIVGFNAAVAEKTGEPAPEPPTDPVHV